MQYLIWDIISKLKLIIYIYIYIANDSKLRLLCHFKRFQFLILRIHHEIFHFTRVIDRDSWADNNRKERDSTVISDVLVVSTERWEELHDKVQRGFYTNRPRGCSRGLADSYQRHQTSSVQRRTGLSKGHEAGGRQKISRLHCSP